MFEIRISMKSKGIILYSLVLSSIFFSLVSPQAEAQEKINLSVGIGFPELINAGIRFQLNQTQLGLAVGAMPVKDGTSFAVSGDVFYHFAGSSDFSDRRPWYGRGGLNYWRNESEYAVDEYAYLNFRLGRDFNFSKKFGMQADAGVIFQLSHKETRKVPSDGWDFSGLEFPVLPGVGLGLFYRL